MTESKIEIIWAVIVILILMLIGFIILSIGATFAWAGEKPPQRRTYSSPAFISIGTREITAYHAVKEECDNEPNIGAYGRVANKGIPNGSWFACNFLPAGTRIIIPHISGNRVWTCRDRISRKLGHRIDLLYPVGKGIGLRKEEVFKELKK